MDSHCRFLVDREPQERRVSITQSRYAVTPLHVFSQFYAKSRPPRESTSLIMELLAGEKRLRTLKIVLSPTLTDRARYLLALLPSLKEHTFYAANKRVKECFPPRVCQLDPAYRWLTVVIPLQTGMHVNLPRQLT